jgi:Arc/MetJ-type ribon-helix-helix transcriptional regulator
MTPVEKGTYRLVASLIREGRRKLEKQSKGGVAVDPAQIALLAQLADRAQAIAMGEEQPDLFSKAEV